MRKMVFGRQLSRGRKGREALLRSLIRALVISGKITTTKAKAKAVIGQVDKLVTIAKENSVAARRRALAFLGNDRKTVDLLFQKIAPQFVQREGGYTRIIPLPNRRGDAAEMARLEWVEEIAESEKVKAKSVKKEKKVAKKDENISTKTKRN